jgi:N6-adenosine-specific RNA methylase IME4
MVLADPMAIDLREAIVNVAESSDEVGLRTAVTTLMALLDRVTAQCSRRQRSLFPDHRVGSPASERADVAASGEIVTSLAELTGSARKFRTIYADPPWPYQNQAARGAAVNHYPVMPLDEIRREPVAELAADDAHLHLWTTNSFLFEALELIEIWGFRYKSSFVWVKPELGCGNYWRVSHEFLLLGVRGKLPFHDRCQQSWLAAPRMEHSRKPGRIRMLIERVSPGPYLELYGRAAIPHSNWTVYGNQVERRLF